MEKNLKFIAPALDCTRSTTFPKPIIYLYLTWINKPVRYFKYNMSKNKTNFKTADFL